jgi:tetratricopeptide (TPR) repeat protein
MRTLYDFLGALPNDDAESLRAAFRRAAKDAHPDLNPGDPDAALRFRQLVRANEILSDEGQRAVYDRLLDLARLEQQAMPKGDTTAAICRITDSVAYGVIFLTGALVVFVGGYVLFGLANAVPRAPTHMTEVFGYEPPQAIAVTTGLSHTRDRTDGHNVLEGAVAPAKLDEDPEDLKQAAAQNADAAAVQSAVSATENAHVPRVRDFGINDAKHYRERGISAYRTGDLHLALVDFDLAIQYDPASPDTYIDRAIVFYRLGDRQRAFADITQAKRIHHESNRDKAPIAGAP